MTTVTHDPRDEVAQLRVPPHSQAAEQSVIGSLLIDNNAWDRVADLLSESDFYRHENKTVYTALARLINSNRPADVVTVFDALGDKAQDVGGLDYLNALAQSVPSASNVRRYAEIVRERSILRQLLAKVDEAGSLVYGEGTAAEKVEQVQALFAGIESRSNSRHPIAMDAVMVKVIDGINAAAEGAAEVWRTGVHALDNRMLGGMRPSDFIVLAARPSVGKTSLALQVARRVARDGHPVLILSQEMAAEQLGIRTLASTAHVDMAHLQTGKLDDAEWSRIAQGVDELASLPIHVDDEPALSLRAIASKARRVQGVKLIVVDYLQLSEGEGDTRTAQIGSISRGLKGLAKKHKCAVLALSQLNRKVEERPGKRPIMADLRDSGEIEQDADGIVFLWPLEEAGGTSRAVGCEVAKYRQGVVGAGVLELFGATQTWGDSTRTLDQFESKKRSGGFE